MARRVVEHAVPHKRTRKYHLELLVRPVLSWKVLEEHYQLLEIKLLELFWPLIKQSD